VPAITSRVHKQSLLIKQMRIRFLSSATTSFGAFYYANNGVPKGWKNQKKGRNRNKSGYNDKVDGQG
jgi:hypothetical protein